MMDLLHLYCCQMPAEEKYMYRKYMVGIGATWTASSGVLFLRAKIRQLSY